MDIPMSARGALNSGSLQSAKAAMTVSGASSNGQIGVPQRVTGAVNSTGTAQRPMQPQQGYANQQQRPVQPQQGFVNQQQRPAQPQQGFVNQQQRPMQPQQGYANQQQRPVQTQQGFVNQQQRPVQPPQQPVQPQKPSAPPLPSGGDVLRRGQKISVVSGGQPVQRLRIGLRWHAKDSRCELDASSFLLGENEKVPSDAWFVFYGQDTSPDRSLHYRGYEGGDGAEIDIDMGRIDPRIQKITVAVTIYEALSQRLNFSMVDSVKAVLIDANRNAAIASLDLTDGSPAVTALVVGELYRYKGEWKFNAVGSGVSRDLAGFCGMYGVELE